MGKLLIVRIVCKNSNSISINEFDLPSSVVEVIFVVVRVLFNFPPEKITAIGITILEIIITETQAIMTITTFLDKTPMVTGIIPKYLSIHVILTMPTLKSNYKLRSIIPELMWGWPINESSGIWQ